MIACVRLRPSVRLNVLAPAGIRILGALDQVARQLAQDVEITCGNEGHPSTDPHTTGEAVDVSVLALTPSRIIAVHEALSEILPPALFTVLYEVPTMPTVPELTTIAYVNAAASSPHLHVQRKRGTVYPPVTESA